MKQKTLKQVKRAIKKPSTPVGILNDAQKQNAMPVINFIGEANKAVLSKDAFLFKGAEAFAKTVGTKPKYEDWNAYTAFIENQCVNTFNIAPSTARNYLTDIYAICKNKFALSKPSAQTKHAKAMQKAKAKVSTHAHKSLETIKREIENVAKQGDVKNELKDLIKARDDKQRKEKSEARKAEKKTISKYKNDLRSWFNSLTGDDLQVLAYVKKDWATIKKQSGVK